MKMFLKLVAYLSFCTLVGAGVGQWMIFVLELKLGNSFGLVVFMAPLIIIGSAIGAVILRRMDKKPEARHG